MLPYLDLRPTFDEVINAIKLLQSAKEDGPQQQQEGCLVTAAVVPAPVSDTAAGAAGVYIGSPAERVLHLLDQILKGDQVGCEHFVEL